ncbi:hypothetical protein [Adhaeribacter soli]|uniref:Uncharacterized protein n=1 Tax=Adhaeribacter soli TaxID=2607655 RepID=A0A5N1IH70_9BACT|nr:hypothetical protein [Adhaeribacter soli]KAA9324992.1 hypothetical protein F0P94_18960 [Adhaeribacter soli]
MSHKEDMDYKEGKSLRNQDSTGKGVGVSGQQPGKHEGPVAGDATNTRGQNVPRVEGHGRGAKRAKPKPDNNNA